MKNLNTAVDESETTLAEGNKKYLCTILCREALLEFYKLASQNTGTSNAHLKFIQEGLLFFPQLIPIPSKKG